MTKPAVFCDQCRHYDPTLLEAGEGWPCEEGHKPRFYAPKTMSQAHTNDWGWKRRCDDFKAKPADPLGGAA